MGYVIGCGNESFADNIVDLIDEHTDKQGRLKCSACGESDAYVYRESKLQERGQTWQRWIKGVIRIETKFETYSPYVLLSADTPGGDVTDAHFGYYKDTRPEGRLKHGHGPGGGPAFNKEEILQLVKDFILWDFISVQDVKDILSSFDGGISGRSGAPGN